MARRGDSIYQRGNTWWLDFTHAGRRHVARLGRGISRTVARELAQVKRGAILKGEAGIGGVPSITVKEYAARWLKQIAADVAPKTLQGYTQMLDVYITPKLGDAKVGALRKADVKGLLGVRRSNGTAFSKNTVRLIRATLSVMLEDAVEDGVALSNPARGLRRRGRKTAGTMTQAERQKKIRPLSTTQLEAFLSTASKRQAEWTLFLTMADTGVRPSEALALQWDDLDLQGQTINVARALSGATVKGTKTETERRVELTPRLIDALDRWQTEVEKEALAAERDVAPWIFASEAGEPLDVLAVARRFRRLLGKAKLPRFRLYDLRHSYATHHLATGTPITYVADQLGHAKPTTTLSFYAHWLPTAERAWAARLERVRTGTIPNGIHNTDVEESAARRSEHDASAV